MSWKEHVVRDQIGVIIGRFEPPHNGHCVIFEEAIKRTEVEKIIIFIGSAFMPPTFKNPFSSSDRTYLIRSVIEPMCEKYGRSYSTVTIQQLPDYYSDDHWKKSVSLAVNSVLKDSNLDVVLFGHLKDDSSYYLQEFPTWNFVDVAIENKELVINATDIRLAIFKDDIEYVRNQVPAIVFKWIMDWKSSDKFKLILKEYENNLLTKKQYEGLKYEVPFITTDAIIISDGRLLLTKRTQYPGMGLFSLPGGFLNVKKTLLNSCIETVKKKTGVDLITTPIKMDVIDTVDRSLRGRTITHVYVFNQKRIDEKKLSKNTFFIPLHDLYLYREHMFEDHYLIIEKLLM